MEGFDIEAYIRETTTRSGVPEKVSEPSTLLSVAAQLTTRDKAKKPLKKPAA